MDLRTTQRGVPRPFRTRSVQPEVQVRSSHTWRLNQSVPTVFSTSEAVGHELESPNCTPFISGLLCTTLQLIWTMRGDPNINRRPLAVLSWGKRVFKETRDFIIRRFFTRLEQTLGRCALKVVRVVTTCSCAADVAQFACWRACSPGLSQRGDRWRPLSRGPSAAPGRRVIEGVRVRGILKIPQKSDFWD